MPRFYFNIISDGRGNDPDDMGLELPHRHAAWEMATRYAGESLCDLDGNLPLDGEWRLEVCTSDGARIFQITVRASQNPG
jgi:hypothetical protein